MSEAFAEKIDFSKSQQYSLSIRMSTDGFYFSIYNPTENHSLYYFPKALQENLSLAVNTKKILQETEALHFPYKKVNVSLVTSRFTFIPFELFEEEQAELYFYHNHIRKENEIILYHLLRKANIIVVFSINKTVFQYVKEQFPEADFFPHIGPLIEHFEPKSRLGNSKKAYLHLRPHAIDILCFERGKLLFCNSFLCEETEDQVYYLLYVWKQLNFNQEKDELHLAGTFLNKEELVNTLKKYIRQVYIINPQAEYNLSIPQLDKIHLDLQIISLCGL